MKKLAFFAFIAIFGLRASELPQRPATLKMEGLQKIQEDNDEGIYNHLSVFFCCAQENEDTQQIKRALQKKQPGITQYIKEKQD